MYLERDIEERIYQAQEDIAMEEVAAAVEDGMSLHKASEIYQVLKLTLYDRVMGKVIFGAKSGSSPYLTSEEEELLDFLLKCSDIGYCYSRKQIIAIVQRIVEEFR